MSKQPDITASIEVSDGFEKRIAALASLLHEVNAMEQFVFAGDSVCNFSPKEVALRSVVRMIERESAMHSQAKIKSEGE